MARAEEVARTLWGLLARKCPGAASCVKVAFDGHAVAVVYLSAFVDWDTPGAIAAACVLGRYAQCEAVRVGWAAAKFGRPIATLDIDLGHTF